MVRTFLPLIWAHTLFPLFLTARASLFFPRVSSVIKVRYRNLFRIYQPFSFALSHLRSEESPHLSRCRLCSRTIQN